MNYSQDKRKWVVVYLAVFSALMVTSLYPPVPAYADACKNAVYQLRGTLNQSQGKGGIWKYMEQNSSLKEKSVIGLQVDGKLNRAVVIFENQCAKTKRPSGENFNKINDLLGEAMMIFNYKIGRTPAKKVLKIITDLNQKMDQLIKELEA